MLLAGLLTLACLACLFIEARTTSSGSFTDHRLGPPLELRKCPLTGSDESIVSIGTLLSDNSSLCQRDMQLASTGMHCQRILRKEKLVAKNEEVGLNSVSVTYRPCGIG